MYLHMQDARCCDSATPLSLVLRCVGSCSVEKAENGLIYPEKREAFDSGPRLV
jgi:hypothetical protein